MTKKKFKDQCDVCGQFDFCKGSNGLLLCPKCLKSQKEEYKQKKFYSIAGELNEQTRFIF